MTSAKRRKNPLAVAPRHTKGLHIVALFEGAKGVLVLLAGFGLLALIHKDVHEIAARLIANFHFNPASHYPRIFLDLLERLDDHKLWVMALLSLCSLLIGMIKSAMMSSHEWLRNGRFPSDRAACESC